MAPLTVLSVSPEVAQALRDRIPVVALESTIVSHGFPYPANLECALQCEAIVREEGAIPATIAVIDGVPTVGLDAEQLERIATPGPERVAKVSTRDLGIPSAPGTDGATTVAATMALAARAGIDVFATGGIGGVHRGAETSFDISADLTELSRTSVCVVCAGAKSVLDIGLTLEVLETNGVPVIGFGTDEFPAFYTRKSGHPCSARLDTPEQVADALRVRRDLGLAGGLVVANPIEVAYEIEPVRLDEWISTALSEAAAARVRGRALTPFLLARIHALSQGASEKANKQLVYANARLAAIISAAFARGT